MLIAEILRQLGPRHTVNLTHKITLFSNNLTIFFHRFQFKNAMQVTSCFLKSLPWLVQKPVAKKCQIIVISFYVILSVEIAGITRALTWYLTELKKTYQSYVKADVFQIIFFTGKETSSDVTIQKRPSASCVKLGHIMIPPFFSGVLSFNILTSLRPSSHERFRHTILR